MKAQIKLFIQECDTCQRCKHELFPTSRLLQPLQISKKAWQQISMDFIERLSSSEGYDTISGVVAAFSKYAHFIVISYPFTASTIANIFMQNIFKLHGMTTSIVLDRDKVLTSQYWSDVFKAARTQLKMSSSYHPQTDGQTKRVHQCLETYLRCMTHQNPKKWKKWLFLAEWWHNTTYHTTSKQLH